MPGVAPPSLVAVTGANGFLGSHVCAELLRRGYHVRATVRDPSLEAKTAHLTALAKEVGKGKLEFLAGDLFKQGGYDDAFAGCAGVVHCAAVVSSAKGGGITDPYKQIVEPSTVGTANVCKSVAKHCKTIKRLVHTSSIAAIQQYDKGEDYVFSEKDVNSWSSIENGDYYGLAKTEAEKTGRKMAEEAGVDCRWWWWWC